MNTRSLFLAVFSLSFCVHWGSVVALEPAWQLSLEGPVAATPLKWHDEIVVAGGQSLMGADLNGSVSWTVQLDGDVLSTPAMAEDRLFVHTNAGLTAYTLQREELWQHPSEDLGALVDGRTWGWGNEILSDPWAFYRSSPLVTDSAVVFGNADGVRAISRENGELLWRQFTGPVTTDIVASDDGLLVADWSNHLRKLNPEDGSVTWTFKAQLPSAPYATWIGWKGLHLTPVVAEGQAFLGSRGTYFYSINVESGRETWSNKHGTSWIGSPAIVDEGNVYFGLSDGKGLVGIDRSSGNQTLFVPMPGPVFAMPVIAGQYLFAGTLRGELLVVDLEKGLLKSSHRLHDSPRPYNSYFQPDPDSTLSAYQFTVRQMNIMKREQRSVLSMAVIDELLLVGTGSGNVLAFKLADLISRRE